MKIFDLIDDDTRRLLKANKPVVHRQPKKNNEQLSTREWEDIMGKHRDTYKRVNGKIKKK